MFSWLSLSYQGEAANGGCWAREILLFLNPVFTIDGCEAMATFFAHSVPQSPPMTKCTQSKCLTLLVSDGCVTNCYVHSGWNPYTCLYSSGVQRSWQGCFHALASSQRLPALLSSEFWTQGMHLPVCLLLTLSEDPYGCMGLHVSGPLITSERSLLPERVAYSQVQGIRICVSAEPLSQLVTDLSRGKNLVLTQSQSLCALAVTVVTLSELKNTSLFHLCLQCLVSKILLHLRIIFIFREHCLLISPTFQPLCQPCDFRKGHL